MFDAVENPCHRPIFYTPMPIGSPDYDSTACSKEVEEGYTVIKTLGKGRFTEVKEV